MSTTIKECPICENEEIKETDNYCKICGYKLKNNENESEDNKNE